MNFIDGGPEWLMSFIKPNISWLGDNLTLDLPILQELMSENLLTAEDIENLEIIRESRRKVHELFFTILRGKGGDVHEKLFAAFERSGRKFIVEYLQQNTNRDYHDREDHSGPFSREHVPSEPIRLLFPEGERPQSSHFSPLNGRGSELSRSFSGVQESQSKTDEISKLEREVQDLKLALRQKNQETDGAVAVIAGSLTRTKELCKLLERKNDELEEENRSLQHMVEGMKNVTVHFHKMKILELENQFLRREVARLKEPTRALDRQMTHLTVGDGRRNRHSANAGSFYDRQFGSGTN